MYPKKLLSILIIAIAATGTAAWAALDKNPTSELSDRRNSTEAAVKTAALMESMLEESKKTNELLEKLIEETKNAGARR